LSDDIFESVLDSRDLFGLDPEDLFLVGLDVCLFLRDDVLVAGHFVEVAFLVEGVFSLGFF